MTSKNRGPAHYNCNINVKQKQSNVIPISFQNISNYDCHLFFKTLIDKKPENKNFSVIPKANEEYVSVNHGCLKFIDSYRFLQSSLDELVKTLNEEDFKILKKEFPDNWELLNKKLAYPYEYFKNLEEYNKDISTLTKQDYFSKLKNDYPNDIENRKDK